MEVWKDVVGYEGIYEVSNKGRVRTHKNKTTYTKRHGVRKWRQIILKNKNPKGRDVRVALWKDGKHKDFLVHRLVAYAFIPQIEGKTSINHIDGNPKNNNVENLEWCDHRDNNNHAFDNGLMTTNKVIFLVDKITNESHYFRSMTKAGRFLGKSHGYISNALKSGETEVEGYRIFIALRPEEYDKVIS